jgi:hypothetical protein
MKYHQWLEDENIILPAPEDITKPVTIGINGKTLKAGIGVHDSSASLVPYLMSAKENFILVSTGTWCINMNPFNHLPLTKEELESDCLNFLSVNMKPVKSSRLFLGRIHDLNVQRLAEHFGVPVDFYKNVMVDDVEIRALLEKDAVFFNNGVPEEYVDSSVDLNVFKDVEQAYRSLVIDLARLVKASVELVMDAGNRHLYITGGFTRNRIFTKAMALLFDGKEVYTSEIDNATSLGAAMLVQTKDFKGFDLGLKRV